MTLPDHLTGVDAFEGTELDDTAEAYALHFRWFAQPDVAGPDVRPSVPTERLAAGPPVGMEHVIQRG